MTAIQKTVFVGKINQYLPGHTVVEPLPPRSAERSQFSVEAEDSAITSVPMPCLRKMFMKAANLLGEGG